MTEVGHKDFRAGQLDSSRSSLCPVPPHTFLLEFSQVVNHKSCDHLVATYTVSFCNEPPL